MFKKSVAFVALLALLVAASPTPIAAASPEPDVPAVVLPEAAVLDDAELAEVEGAVLKTMVVGAAAGFVSYGVGQLYDGIVHDEWSWSWADAGKAAVSGAIAGAFGKFF